MVVTTPMTAIERIAAVVTRLESKAHGAQCVDVVECTVRSSNDRAHRDDERRLLCIDKHTQMTTADPRLANAALRELDMHLTLQQQPTRSQRSHVVQLHGYRLEGERLHLFQEYCARGDLLTVVRHDVRMDKAGLPAPTSASREPTTRSEDGVRRIFAQTLAGVAELHRAGIAHLDLSLENVFVTADGDVRVGDLGLAERFERDGMGQVERQCPQSVAKVAYAAPEMHVAFAAGIPIDVSKADAWALGVMLWHLWAKQPLFQTATRDDPLFRLMESSGSSAAALATRAEFAVAPCGVRDLLAQLLCVDPLARLSVQDAQRHPWLNARVAAHSSPTKLKVVRIVAPATEMTTAAVMVTTRATSNVVVTKSSVLVTLSSTSTNTSNKPTSSPQPTGKVRSGSYSGEIVLEKTRVSIRRSVTASAAASSGRSRSSSNSVVLG